MMGKHFAFAVALIPLLFTALPALAGQYGTAEEAEALLTRAVAEVKADPEAALVKFNDPDGDFRDRDLYVFCAGLADGRLIAHPELVGTDLRTLSDTDGKPFGEEMLDRATEGTFTDISYMWPRPGTTEPVEKLSRITRVGDLMCGVGYYKE